MRGRQGNGGNGTETCNEHRTRDAGPQWLIIKEHRDRKQCSMNVRNVEQWEIDEAERAQANAINGGETGLVLSSLGTCEDEVGLVGAECGTSEWVS